MNDTQDQLIKELKGIYGLCIMVCDVNRIQGFKLFFSLAMYYGIKYKKRETIGELSYVEWMREWKALHVEFMNDILLPSDESELSDMKGMVWTEIFEYMRSVGWTPRLIGDMYESLLSTEMLPEMNAVNGWHGFKT